MRTTLVPQNLRNLFVTAGRVCRCGNRIGLFQLLLYALAIPLTPADLTLAACQALIGRRAGTAQRPILFVSGYSRSGTTLVFQALAQVFDNSEYTNNLVILFPRSYPLVAAWYRRLCSRRTASYDNFYGRTMGLYGTNDAPQLVNAWLPDEVLAADSPLAPRHAQRILNFFRLREHFAPQPFLMKNCNLYLKYEELARLLPSARFIFVKRLPEFIVDSTIRAREFVQGTRDCRWEFSRVRYHGGLMKSDPIREVCLNLKESYDMMDAFALRWPDRVRVLSYESFCAAPRDQANSLGNWFLGRAPSATLLERLPPAFHVSERMRVSTTDQERILSTIQEVFEPTQASAKDAS